MSQDIPAPPFPDFTGTGTLHASDLEAELNAQIASQNAYDTSLRQWGVVRGLGVRIGATAALVEVEAGMALDGLGNVLILDAAQSISIAEVFHPEAWIVLSLRERPADWRMFPAAAGYTRIERDIVIEALGKPPADPSIQIVMAQVVIGTDQQVAALEPGSRRGSMLTVGKLVFPRPSAPAASALSIGPGESSASLQLNAPQVDLFGSAGGPACLRIGPVDPAVTARLAIQAPGSAPGQSRVSNSDAEVFSTSVGGLSSLTAGDTIFVDTSCDQTGAAARTTGSDVETLKVIQTRTPDTVRVDRTPAQDFVNAPYRVRRINILRVRDTRGRSAMVAQLGGRIGLGTSQPRNALSISGGDLELSGDNASPRPALAFQTSGSVEGADGAHGFGVPSVSAALTVRSKDALTIFTGEAGPDTTPSIVLDAFGHSGIGVAKPACTLSVNGTIRASEGLVFPDGTVQTTVVVEIPVGTVIDWWRPAGAPEFDVEGFQICNGSTITDPESPFKGLTTPDLDGALVRGVTDFNSAGKSGGSTTHTHDFVAAEHTHSMFHQHQVKGTTSPTKNGAGEAIAGSTVAHLNHVHEFDITSSDPSPSYTGPNNQPLDGTTGPGSSLPKHMCSLKVMRIK